MPLNSRFACSLVLIAFRTCGAQPSMFNKVTNHNYDAPEVCVKLLAAKPRFVHNALDMTCLKWTSTNFADHRTPRLSAPPLRTPHNSSPFSADFTHRRPLSVSELDDLMTKALNSADELNNKKPSERQQAEICDGSRCHALPRSCCDAESQVVTPLNATSAITGKQVTIAQYPGLFIQTVVFSKCRHANCSFIRGICRQKYSPYLLMTVHPPGPVTIFGQDYILVESGCACEPDLDDNNRASLLSPSEFLNVLSSDKISAVKSGQGIRVGGVLPKN